MAWLARHEQTLLSILRIITGLLFLEHGTQKLLGFPAPIPTSMLAGIPPAMMKVILTAGVIELVGGFLITIGLFTRVAAFICSGEMAAAYFLGHMSRGGFWPVLNGGGEAILFCFVFLFIAAAGPGPIGVSRSARF